MEYAQLVKVKEFVSLLIQDVRVEALGICVKDPTILSAVLVSNLLFAIIISEAIMAYTASYFKNIGDGLLLACCNQVRKCRLGDGNSSRKRT